MPTEPSYPGVYVEELPARVKSIEGVDTKSEPRAIVGILGYAGRKVDEFQAAPKQNFRDIIKTNWRARTDTLRHPGVYILFSKGKPIYVGMAGKGGHHLNYRLGDLFFYSPGASQHYHHTLTEKLLAKRGEFKSIGAVRKFYFSCRLKTIETETFQQARTLEAILIELLKPKYND